MLSHLPSVPRHLSRVLVLAGSVAALAACVTTDDRGAASQRPLPTPAAATQEACRSLALNFVYPGLRVTAAEVVPAGTFKEQGVVTASPDHCLVTGRMNERRSEVDGETYAIGFEMRLPLAWKGRFFYQANGGIDGVVQPAAGRLPGGAARDSALNRGFAVISSDAGHAGGQNPWFGLDPQARLDYGYNAVGTLTPMAKSLQAALYGKPPDRSYIAGCSNGGRHAMVAASRFPGSYDGFLAGNPGFNLPQAAMAQMYGAQQYAKVAKLDEKGSPDLASAVTPSEFGLLSRRIVERCDALDGLADGMVSNTAVCQREFQLERDVPTCQGERNGQCFTAAQKQVVADVMRGPRNSKGEAVYASFPYDPGMSGQNWAFWEFVASQRLDPGAAFIFLTPPVDRREFMATGGLRYALGLDMDRDAPKIFATTPRYPVASMTFMTPPQATRLDGLRRSGGKLLVYHGTADPVFSFNDTAAWYEALGTTHGGQLSSFARLFAVPGMNHCSGGPAADQFDALEHLVAWVEKGIEPEHIVANVRGAGANVENKELPAGWSATRSRPLCPYPAVARHDGKGDQESAASFVCTR
jgi:pimeloyl-ACP methyl ester carboxylesterase